MANHIITEKSVQKIFLTHALHPLEKVMLLVLTDTYVVHIELEDYGSLGRSEVWITNGKIWNKESAPSLYDLDKLLCVNGEGDVELEMYPSLHSYKEEDVVALLKEVQFDGKTLILPKEEAGMYMDTPVKKHTSDSDIPF